MRAILKDIIPERWEIDPAKLDQCPDPAELSALASEHEHGRESSELAAGLKAVAEKLIVDMVDLFVKEGQEPEVIGQRTGELVYRLNALLKPDDGLDWNFQKRYQA